MKLLIIYDAEHTHTQAIYDYLMAFKKYSINEVDFFNVDQKHRSALDFSGYDAVIVNFCILYTARSSERPDHIEAIIPALAAFRGLKIAIEQDPYDQTNAMKRFIIAIGASVVLTVIPAAHVRYIYPEPWFDQVRFETVLSGYLDEDGLNAPAVPLAARPIALGYRGRNIPARLGDMGWHKSEIARQFKAACERRGIEHDIESDEEKRFHGEAWLHFVRSCRVMLGVPSGSNIFDYDGLLHARVMAAWEMNKHLTYPDVREWIERERVPFDMGQISPRVFEAVSSKTALALLRGSYSGVIEPDLHYVPVEPDYSNVESVLDRILDADAMSAMAERAYNHVIGNPENHYDWFVAGVDAMVEKRVVRADLNAASLRVTDHPLGNDSYLLEKKYEAQRSVRDQVGDLLRKIFQEKKSGYVSVDSRTNTITLIPQASEPRRRSALL